MKDFVRIFTRFLPKYKGCVVANVICYILTTIFSLFSFGTIIPILQILFGMETASHEYMTWTFADSFKYIVDALKNNLFFYIEDYIRTYGGANTMLILGVFMIFMTFLKTGTAYLAGYFMIPIRFGVLRDIRMDLYNKILSLPMGFYSEERKGDIMARMTNDVTEVGTSIMTSLEAIFKNPIMIIIYFSVMIAISWELTLFILVMLPIVGVIIGRVGKSLKTRSMLGQTQQGSLLSIIEETLGGLRIIKAFNAEKKASSRFEQLNTTVMNTFNKIERRYILAHPVSEFLGTAIIVIVLWYGGTLILSENANAISAPAFIYYLVIFYSLINPCKELSKAVYTIQRGLASLARVDVILGAENVIKEKENPTQIEAFKDEISFNNVSFKYQSDWVLKDISLKIKKGQMVALVGQSGSGKSTMVDLIPRFYDVQKGSVTIDGIDVRDVRTYDLRALMGNVNQEAILFNDTFYNNITFGVENPTMEEVVAAAKIANAHDFIMASESGYETNI
jgi:ATP-binding cassette subfamily B protein/subfamily B ATP-binding cassette protein MsbA